jgi:hypothetical protein
MVNAELPNGNLAAAKSGSEIKRPAAPERSCMHAVLYAALHVRLTYIVQADRLAPDDPEL